MMTSMRNTHSCPKCRSAEVVRVPGKVGASGLGNNFIPVGSFILKAVLVTRYLCTYCGFSEEWVDERADLDKLRDTYNG